ncbi:MAG TPA: uridine kinase [Thermotogota bacterium]|nr:uridine kinase [Thermotogota bacterium]HPJ87573.1 uridine kinase [Thermotogota bacterium]HPR94778.1 uridine kinase [Thermotogota bacterium]
MIAIIGGSGSGKTTVARKINSRLKERSTLIKMDNYYKDLPPGTSPQDVNFDSPVAFDFDLFYKHINELKNGNPVQVPDYSFITYRREPGIFHEVSPKDVVIVEGILVLYEERFRSLFDLSVFIDTPDDERLLRRIERDMKERNRSIESIIGQYRKYVAPSFKSFVEPQKYYADLILPEGGFNSVGLNIIYDATIQKINS